MVIIRYKPIFVKDICTLPNISPLTLKRFLMVNWSKGLWCKVNGIELYKDISIRIKIGIRKIHRKNKALFIKALKRNFAEAKLQKHEV